MHALGGLHLALGAFHLHLYYCLDVVVQLQLQGLQFDRLRYLHALHLLFQIRYLPLQKVDLALLFGHSRINIVERFLVVLGWSVEFFKGRHRQQTPLLSLAGQHLLQINTLPLLVPEIIVQIIQHVF